MHKHNTFWVQSFRLKIEKINSNAGQRHAFQLKLESGHSKITQSLDFSNAFRWMYFCQLFSIVNFKHFAAARKKVTLCIANFNQVFTGFRDFLNNSFWENNFLARDLEVLKSIFILGLTFQTNTVRHQNITILLLHFWPEACIKHLLLYQGVWFWLSWFISFKVSISMRIC